MDKTEYAKLTAERENMYLFLGQIFEKEVNQEILNKMSELSLSGMAGDEDDFVEGLYMMSAYLEEPELDPVTKLAVDYARVFLGAGIHKGGAAFPYESVYTSPEKLIMQDAWEQVVAIYKSKGVCKAGNLNFPEDHIALELKFMAHLCKEYRQACEAGDWQAAKSGLKEQMDFMNRHLLNWVPEFCSDIEKYSKTAFYKALGKMTCGFLNLDRAMLEDLIYETAV